MCTHKYMHVHTCTQIHMCTHVMHAHTNTHMCMHAHTHHCITHIPENFLNMSGSELHISSQQTLSIQIYIEIVSAWIMIKLVEETLCIHIIKHLHGRDTDLCRPSLDTETPNATEQRNTTSVSSDPPTCCSRRGGACHQVAHQQPTGRGRVPIVILHNPLIMMTLYQVYIQPLIGFPRSCKHLLQQIFCISCNCETCLIRPPRPCLVRPLGQ